MSKKINQIIDVSVIFVNYNTKHFTEKAISSILKYTEGLNYEVIVVDNDSTDDSCTYLSEKFKEHKQIKIIDNKENVGFGRGCNVGIKLSKAKYIHLLNPDAYFNNNALLYYFKFAEENKKLRIGALGSYLLNDDESIQYSHGTFYFVKKDILTRFKTMTGTLIPASSRKLIKENFRKEYNKEALPLNVEYILGANLFIPRSVLIEINGFDPDYFLMTEENDLQYRMMIKGYDRILIDGPKVFHENEGSFNEKTSNLRRIMQNVGRLTFVRKHRNIIIYLFYKTIMTIGICLELILDLIPRRYTFSENLKFLRLFILERFKD